MWRDPARWPYLVIPLEQRPPDPAAPLAEDVAGALAQLAHHAEEQAMQLRIISERLDGRTDVAGVTTSYRWPTLEHPEASCDPSSSPQA